MSNLLLYINTLRYLKPVQIRYRIYYFLLKKIRNILNLKYPAFKKYSIRTGISFSNQIENPTSFLGRKTFVFLNKEVKFDGRIDWNYSGYGKLWTYNLNYFEFLHQKAIDTKDALFLINDFIDNFNEVKDGLEPYPTSLRIINWIKFLASNNIQDTRINENLYAQVHILSQNLEYHLLGNHLLENAFALTFAGIYFDDDKLFSRAKKLLISQLTEQILEDGAHFELSPMYHQLMLYRLLDTINIFKQAPHIDNELYLILNKKASAMLGWLEKITFSNGDIPHFNDSTAGIAPTTDQLVQYSEKLGTTTQKIKLSSNGYRKYSFGDYEMVVDTGKIGPDYIPGHAHCDIMSFVLYSKGKPLIVDTGISVYGGNSKLRYRERSTSAHNTVMVMNYEQAEIWGDFRVARRSYPRILKEKDDLLEVEYKHFSGKYIHKRIFIFHPDSIEIKDEVTSPEISKSFLHFHDSVDIAFYDNKIKVNDNEIFIENGKLKISNFDLSKGFYKKAKSKKAEISFINKCNLIIKFNA